MRPLRVLIVDDSAVNRRTLTDLLSQMPGVTVVGAAQDGDEALRSAATLAPDLITLDLEMPRMDGFTFLRLLMASRPTPVLVVSRGHRWDFWPWRHRPGPQMVKMCRSAGSVKPCGGSPSVWVALVWECLSLAGSSRRSSGSCTAGPVGGCR